MNEPTKIAAGVNFLRRVEDLDDLAKVLFPGNPRHQYSCAVILFVLKWSDSVVVDLGRCVGAQGVTKRVFERTRAKMHRLGIIDHVSRFSRRHGHCDGWVLSTKFQASLELLAQQVRAIKEKKDGKQREKDEFAINLLRPGEPCDTLPFEALRHEP